MAVRSKHHPSQQQILYHRYFVWEHRSNSPAQPRPGSFGLYSHSFQVNIINLPSTGAGKEPQNQPIEELSCTTPIYQLTSPAIQF